MWSLILLGWLIPGSGFLIKRQTYRGLSIFVILNLTFILGLVNAGGVMFPALSPSAPGFSYVNILIFLGQIGNGLLSLLCILAREISTGFAASIPFLSGLIHIFNNPPVHAFFEIGSFYLVVSGTMNYFVLCNFYDRYTGKVKG